MGGKMRVIGRSPGLGRGERGVGEGEHVTLDRDQLTTRLVVQVAGDYKFPHYPAH